MPVLQKPETLEYNPSFTTYIERVSSPDVLDMLAKQKQSFSDFVRHIPGAKAGYRYAENKWSVAEVVGHVIDTERVLAWRTLAISRNDKETLPGFDENTYVAHANFKDRTLADLAEEFVLVRASNLKLLESFTPAMFGRMGMANGHNCSVRALTYIMAGHLAHHEAILRERYGLD